MEHRGTRQLQLRVIGAVMGNPWGWRQEDLEEPVSQLGQGREGVNVEGFQEA